MNQIMDRERVARHKTYLRFLCIDKVILGNLDHIREIPRSITTKAATSFVRLAGGSGVSAFRANSSYRGNVCDKDCLRGDPRKCEGLEASGFGRKYRLRGIYNCQ